MAQVRGDFVEGMKKTAYDYFFKEHDLHAPVAPEIFRERPLTAAWEQWTTIVSDGQLQEKTSESQDAPVRSTAEGFTIFMRAHTFHERHVYSKETIADHQKIANLVEERARKWGEGVYLTKEVFYADFFNSGGFTAGKQATFGQDISGVLSTGHGAGVYDGTAASVQPFFNLSSATRSSKGGATYSNGNALRLNSDNLETDLILLELTNAKTESDQQMKLVADTLLVPINLERQARRLMKSEKEPENALNAANVFADRLRVIPWAFLTSTTAWFVGVAKRGIVMGNRQDPEIRMFIDERSRSMEAVIDVRFGGCVEDWRPWVGSSFATS